QVICEPPLRTFALGKKTGRFDDDVNAQVFPWELRWLALFQDLDRLAVDGEFPFAGLDSSGESAVNAVIAKERGEMLGIGQVVDCDDIKGTGSLHHCAKNETAYTSKAINTHAKSHFLYSFCFSSLSIESCIRAGSDFVSKKNSQSPTPNV